MRYYLLYGIYREEPDYLYAMKLPILPLTFPVLHDRNMPSPVAVCIFEENTLFAAVSFYTKLQIVIFHVHPPDHNN